MHEDLKNPSGAFPNYQSYSLYLRQSATADPQRAHGRLITKGITTRRG
jgi:hypothetical protein